MAPRMLVEMVITYFLLGYEQEGCFYPTSSDFLAY
jgi:hypothetical protein